MFKFTDPNNTTTHWVRGSAIIHIVDGVYKKTVPITILGLTNGTNLAVLEDAKKIEFMLRGADKDANY